MRYFAIITLLLALNMGIMAKPVAIRKVMPVSVDCPVGTVPRLPWQVWVTYSNGKGEWRQVKWNNYTVDIERYQADAALTPVGSSYKVAGYVIGDDTTPKGFPIEADVNVVAGGYQTPPNKLSAHPLPLSDVTLTGDNRLTSNRDLDIDMLLSLDVTQQLYNYRDTYGLPTDGYTTSNGWDSPVTKLKGHGTGHYLSALAFAYASADGTKKAQLLQRIRRMVTELRECQERTFVWDDSLGRYREARDYAPEGVLKDMKGTWEAFDEYKKDFEHYGYGYLNAIPAAHPALIECYRPYNNSDWVWAPYYSIHKQLAGLIDIAVNVDDREVAAKALLIAKDMGLWVWNRMHYRTYVKLDGTQEERRQRPGNRSEMWNMYIAGEVGGMAESLARLSEMVTDASERDRLLEAANCFDAPILFNNVAVNIDDVRTRHANQHIPMFIGALRSYICNGNPYYYNLAQNFWDMMMGRYVYAMGGVGNGEMWRQPYSQMTSMNTNVMSDEMGKKQPNPDLNETCCAYNLAKLTKDLNCFRPDDARYMDYYERVMYNQIVGSVHPADYSVCYQYAVGLGAVKPYGSRTPQESCCGGTGAENHVKYQEAAYFVNDNTLWVSLFLPTNARWREKGVGIVQECQWPAERSTLRFSGQKEFAVKIRVPYWATEGFDVRLNGKSLVKRYQPCSYFEIPTRKWQDTDVVEVIMPFTKHICYGADKMEMAYVAEENGAQLRAFAPQWLGALMLGPLVMTSPDIHSWSDATFKGFEKSSVNNQSLIINNGKTLNFIPDYAATTNSTHYLRIQPSGAKKGMGESLAIDTERLSELVTEAHNRRKAMEDWGNTVGKTAGHAPWAPNGYKCMLSVLAEAEDVTKCSAKTVSALNVALLTMRPGNLAEPEDLADLLAMMESRQGERSKDMNYARMVVRYVNDGSGTKDMIVKAMDALANTEK